MSFTTDEFLNLEKRFGKYSSWAIWSYGKDTLNEKSVQPIYDNISLLNSRNVLIGLNISSEIDTWGNFRGGRHDRKLKYAFNDSPLKGCYMTDLFKDEVEVKSTEFYARIQKDIEGINRNVGIFLEEMKAVGITDKTRFVILGTENSYTGKLYRKYFLEHFPTQEVVYHRHYSSRGTDQEWVESIWKTLGIEGDFKQVVNRYQEEPVYIS